MIKDIERDPYGYQRMRNAIKLDESKLPYYQDVVTKHIKERLGNTTFNHHISQKETIIFQD